MPLSFNLASRIAQVVAEFERAVRAPGEDLAPAALAIAHIEYPSLDPGPYLNRLDRMGEQAGMRLSATADAPREVAVRVFNEFLYDELGFSGNRERYDDPRNSYLNEVLDRRTGIPISLAVIYLEVARRAGLRMSGVNFPGHFLLRAETDASSDALIVDPFHGGALLSEYDCRQLLRRHMGEEAAFDESLLAPASRHDILVRMLVNLKRLYVRMRSLPQARFVSTLLLAVDPSAVSELRDRGLIAFHLEDFPAALRDLEEYLRLAPRMSDTPEPEFIPPGDDEDDEEPRDEAAAIWEHVKALRKRVASFN